MGNWSSAYSRRRRTENVKVVIGEGEVLSLPSRVNGMVCQSGAYAVADSVPKPAAWPRVPWL